VSDFKADWQNILPNEAFKIFASEMIFYLIPHIFHCPWSENIFCF